MRASQGGKSRGDCRRRARWKREQKPMQQAWDWGRAWQRLLHTIPKGSLPLSVISGPPGLMAPPRSRQRGRAPEVASQAGGKAESGGGKSASLGPMAPLRGRPPKLTDEDLRQMIEIYWTQLLSVRDIAKRFGVSHMTVWRAVQ